MIRLVLTTVLDTAMLNAHMTLSSSMEKLMPMDGPQANLTLTLELASMDPAVWNSTFGRLIASHKHLPLIHAQKTASIDVKELNAVMTLLVRDSREFATRMAVILPLSEMETRTSTDQEASSQSTLPSHSLLSPNSTPTMEPIVVRSSKS